ncbi:hypothetical protein J6590_005699 [Homalodisca vitripennis]|nr:hypothetical protein J6590_005699 [Homalodisca vitripennis]
MDNSMQEDVSRLWLPPERLQKKAIRTIANMNFRESCRPAFITLQLLTLPCLYV